MAAAICSVSKSMGCPPTGHRVCLGVVSGFELPNKYTTMWRYMNEAGLPNSTEEAIERVLASPGPIEGYPIEGYAYIGKVGV